MFFTEIGLLLKNKREEKGISQKDVANKLKIPLRSVIAIEDGELDELPHEAYVRTFSKGYANYLGFSAEEIQNIFSDIEDFSNKSEPPKSVEATGAETYTDGSKSRNGRFILQLLIVAFLGVSVYFYYAHNGRSETFNLTSLLSLFKSDEPSESPVLDVKNDAKNKNKEVSVDIDKKKIDGDANIKQKNGVSETLTPANDQDITGQNEKSKTSLKNDTEHDIPVNNNEVLVPEVVDLDLLSVDISDDDDEFHDMGNLESFIANTPEAFVIDWNILSDVKQNEQQAVIYVSQDCWMHVTVDGKAMHFTLRKGNQKELIFKDTLQLKLGNASAVTLFHNRKLVDVGDSTVLRTISLDAE